MLNRKIAHIEKVYILDGVKSFLTDAALIHKRNLMYASFLCIVLSILGANMKFTSLFGFRIQDAVIEVNSVLMAVSVVVVYEMTMLWAHFKQCKSQWFGKNISADGELEYFKHRLEVGLNESSIGSVDLLSELSNKIDELYDENYRITKETRDSIIEVANACSALSQPIKDDIKLAKKLIDNYGKGGQVQNYLTKSAEDHYAAFKTQMDVIIDNSRSIAKSKGIIESNHAWFFSVSKEIKKLNKSHDELLSRLYKLQGGYERSLFIDFLFPTLFSVLSLSIVIFHIFF